jgi:hypothetical protein
MQGAGVFGISSRAVYAKARPRSAVRAAAAAGQLADACRAVAPPARAAQKHGLPGPESQRVFLDTAGEESKTCIDVCAEFAGQQDCQTRCVRRVRRRVAACLDGLRTALADARHFERSMLTCNPHHLSLARHAEPLRTRSTRAERRAK